MPSLLHPRQRAKLLERFERLTPEHERHWGRLTPASMVAHLIDQMRITLGTEDLAPIPSPTHRPLVRWLVLHHLRWPRDRIVGPPEAFVSDPSSWDADLDELRRLVERFVCEESRTDWPAHSHFGRLSRREWGVFCYRHFDHHLEQFGC